MGITPKAIKILKVATTVAGFGLSLVDAVVDQKILDNKINAQVAETIAKLAAKVKK